jgi:hypothetical protein
MVILPRTLNYVGAVVRARGQAFQRPPAPANLDPANPATLNPATSQHHVTPR